jgi:hypothetical protein
MTCPQCGSARAVPIVYGLPIGEVVKAAERGEVILAGCMVGAGEPPCLCPDCGFGEDWFPNRRKAE